MHAPLPPDGSVLLLIDLQKATDHPSWDELTVLAKVLRSMVGAPGLEPGTR